MAPRIPTSPLKLNTNQSVPEDSAETYGRDDLITQRDDIVHKQQHNNTSHPRSSTTQPKALPTRRGDGAARTTTSSNLRSRRVSTTRNRGNGSGRTLAKQHDDEQDINNNAESTTTLTNMPQDNTISSMHNNPGMYGNYGMSSPYSYGGYGMGMGGMGMGMGMPFGGGGMGPTSGILSNLNQFLYSFQSVIFSLSQAMQIVGMNTQALRQMYGQALSMIDHTLAILQELQTIHKENEGKIMTVEDEKRRRRLKAIRICLVAGCTYMSYIGIIRWLKKRRDWSRRVRSIAPMNYGA